MIRDLIAAFREAVREFRRRRYVRRRYVKPDEFGSPF